MSKLPLSRTAPYAIFGCILSLYALYVEHKVAHKSPDDEEFTALCDIEQIGASCRCVVCETNGRTDLYYTYMYDAFNLLWYFCWPAFVLLYLLD